MGRKISLQDALASDPAPLRAPPAIAAGERHRAAVPEGCLVLSVEAVGMQRTDG